MIRGLMKRDQLEDLEQVVGVVGVEQLAVHAAGPRRLDSASSNVLSPSVSQRGTRPFEIPSVIVCASSWWKVRAQEKAPGGIAFGASIAMNGPKHAERSEPVEAERPDPELLMVPGRPSMSIRSRSAAIPVGVKPYFFERIAYERSKNGSAIFESAGSPLVEAHRELFGVDGLVLLRDCPEERPDVRPPGWLEGVGVVADLERLSAAVFRPR